MHLRCRVLQSVGRSVRPSPLSLQLKVNVPIEGQISNNQILVIMSCPLCKSYTNWKILFDLCSNAHLNSQQGDVHNLCYLCVGLRSDLKVKID